MSFDLKVLLILVLSAVGIRVAAMWLSDRQNRSQESKTVPATVGKETYMGLRNQALHLNRDKIKLAAPSNPKEPWAAVMDWDLGSGIVTVVAISDGTASVYLSSGGGSIGGGQSHDAIRKAAQKMVAAAVECRPQMRATDTFPLPTRGQIIFYALTDEGVVSASAPQEELSSHRHPLSKMGDAAQDVITQYRLIENHK
jgi:hypothetical protein